MSKKFSLEVPLDLSAITLRQYQKYLDIIKTNEGAEKSDFVSLKMIEIFCNTSLKDASELPVKDFSPIISHLNGLFQQDTPLVRDITIKGTNNKEVQLGFIPKLEDMSMGEFVDLDTFIVDWKDMHKAMAVLYRPMKFKRKEKYLIHKYKASDEYYELMKDMPVNIALGAMVFFYRLGKELAKYTMDSLVQQAQKGEAHIQKDLEKSGVGINQYIHSLKEMSKELTRLPNSLSNNALYG